MWAFRRRISLMNARHKSFPVLQGPVVQQRYKSLHARRAAIDNLDPNPPFPPPSILENPSAPPPRLFQLTSINGLTHQGTYEVQIQMEYLQKREPLPSVLAASALACTLKDLQSTFLSEQYSNCLKLLKSARIIRNCISPGSNKRDKTVISFELSLTRQGFRLLHFLNNRGSTCVYSHTTHTGQRLSRNSFTVNSPRKELFIIFIFELRNKGNCQIHFIIL